MNGVIVAALLATASCAACSDEPTSPQVASPPGWRCGATGKGTPRWTVETDASAGQVLKQSGQATFAWCVKPDAKLADGFAEVRFKPLAGKEDQAGGVVWRWQDGNTYYVARANALENNVSLYYTTGGTRHSIQYVDAKVSVNTWHVLRVDFRGHHIQVALDGKRAFEAEDDHITGSGSVGVWTKADSVTVFSELTYGMTPRVKP